MKTLTAAAATATQRQEAAPVYLAVLEFSMPSSKTLYLSDDTRVVGGQEYLPMVDAWGTLEDALNTLDVDGRPATAELSLFNRKPLEGKARISDLIRTPLNTTGTYEWAFTKLTISQLFEELGVADVIVRGVFYLEDPTDIGENLLVVRMTDQALVIDDTLRVTRVSRAEFPTCGKAQVGKSIPRPFGVLTNVPAIPVVDGASSQLNGVLAAGATTITLIDATDMPASSTGMIDVEIVTWSGKSGNQLTGVTRGTNGTTDEAHADRAAIFQLKSGAGAYRFAVGEGLAGFPIKAITNIRVKGQPARTAPTVQLDETGLVAGKHFGMISFTVTDIRAFHLLPLFLTMPQPTTLPVSLNETLDWVGNQTAQRLLTPTLNSAGDAEVTVGPVRRRVTMTFTVLGGSFTLNGTNSIKRRDPATGAVITLFSDATGPNFDFTTGTFEYDTGTSLADETFELNISGDPNSWQIRWEITAYGLSGSILGGGERTGGDSTATRVLGEVTCDVEGIRDDTVGSISGTPSLLLENPADVSRVLLTQLYGISALDLGSTWAVTRASLAAASLKWAMLLDYQLFSQLRRKIGEQARSVLYHEAGRWEYEFLDDNPAASLTLDYPHKGLSATVSRSSRADVRNSLSVSAQRDYSTSDYRYLRLREDLAAFTKPHAADLVLDWIQDAATADAVGLYWLGVWKRQRFAVDLVTAWPALAVEKIDYLSITNHPVLEAHGGASLVFRVVGKTYLVGDDNPGRIRLRLVEV